LTTTRRKPGGGDSIPSGVQTRTELRVMEHAKKNHPGKFTRIEVRFRGAFCYIDAYDSDPNTPIHLCRLRYLGNPDQWGFDFYTYAHEKYERSFLMSGEPQGTPEEAFDTSALFL
jgi:hypothetical protein